jgi:hypothetical protein
MNTFVITDIILFGLIILAQLLRCIFRWRIFVGEDKREVPFWPSYLAVIISAVMLVWAAVLMR